MTHVTIRDARPDDSAQIISHMKRVADEPNNGIASNSSDEFAITEEQERKILQDYAETHNKRYLVAVVDDEIVGTANCAPIGKRSGFQHALDLGITVKKEYRNQGIGTALMTHLIDWAAAHPTVKRLELTVFHNNPRAIHVYEKLGFTHEGTRRAAFRKHGEWLDLIVMAIVWQEKEISE